MIRACMVSVILLLPSVLTAGTSPGETYPEAHKGVMDLRSWNFQSRGPVRLDGEWSFYWERFLDPQPLHASGTPQAGDFLRFPGVWNQNLTGGKRLPGFGYATCRLIILLPDDCPHLSVKLLDMWTAYVLFADGRRVASNGSVSDSPGMARPQALPQIVPLNSAGGSMELVLHISNYHHTLGGPRNSIYLGASDDIGILREKNLAFEMFLFGALLIMALYHFGLFWLRRSDRSPLFLGLFCLLISLRPLITGECFLSRLYPGIGWEIMLKTEFLSLYAGLPLISLFMRSLFPLEFHRYVLRVLLVAGTVFSLIVLATPARIYTLTINIYYLITLPAAVYIVYVIIASTVRKREGAKMFLFGTLVLFVTVLNEILYDMMIINTGNFFPLGLFIFILSQALHLSMKHARAHNRVEILSRELSVKNLRLTDVDRLKDEFLANTSHELRTPLNGIIGIADSLASGAAGPVSERLHDDLALIARSGRRLASLVNDILDFSKLKNSEIALRIVPVDIKAAADVAIELVRYLPGIGDIILESRIPASLPPVLADEDRLQQVLLNLLGNAIKFTRKGNVTLTACLIRKGADGQFVEVSVSDTGTGIAPERTKMIFEPFEQEDGSVTRRFGGTGLGLPISRKLVELHGGSIDVESREGEGSRFYFTLPAATHITTAPLLTAVHAPANTVPEVRITEDMNVRDSGGDGSMILIVDDDPVNLRVMENHLVLAGYRVISCRGAREALDLIGSGVMPDLVILDIMMPGISGFEAARSIRENFNLHQVPLMFITARNRKEDIIAGFAAGANDFLTKPVDHWEMLTRAETLINLKRMVEEGKKLDIINHQLEIARKIQLSSLPGGVPQPRGLGISAHYHPMEGIGGDFYDFHIISGEETGILIVDVTGHGIPAALIASMVKIIFFMLRHLATAPGELLTEMNRIFRENIKNQFITAGYLYINRTAMKVVYARAGHPPLVTYNHSDDRLAWLNPPGRLIGFGDTIYTSESADLSMGDRLVLFTDGITEEMNHSGEFFGDKHFENLLRNDTDRENLVSGMMSALKKWRGRENPSDDVTMIVVDVE